MGEFAKEWKKEVDIIYVKYNKNSIMLFVGNKTHEICIKQTD